MTNYFNKMIDKLKQDYALIDKQVFTAVSAESGSPIGNQKFRWNNYDLQTCDSAGTWSNNNPMRTQFFMGVWVPKKGE